MTGSSVKSNSLVGAGPGAGACELSGVMRVISGLAAGAFLPVAVVPGGFFWQNYMWVAFFPMKRYRSELDQIFFSEISAYDFMTISSSGSSPKNADAGTGDGLGE
jgi:hypothetical protein